jgi:N-acetyl-anhydromuramyl-L-alanine amidase AmpD
MSIEFIKAWQTFMNSCGKLGKNGKPLTVDGDYGDNSRYATISFQSYYNLPQSGQVDEATLKAAGALGFKAPAEIVSKYPFVPAKWFTPGPRRCPITVLVIHDMEAPEGPKTAENVASYFKDPKDKDGNPVKASAHYNVDSDSIVCSVKDEDIAWHAPGANSNGIGIEHAGYARQTREEWLDEYSTATLKRSAKLVAELCIKYGIPVKWLTVDELKANQSGICGHVDITNAFNGGKGHTDPGPGWPRDIYIQWVQEAYDRLTNSDDVPDDASNTTNEQ